MTTKTKTRAEVAVQDTWDLSKLFKNDAAWDASLAKYEADSKKIPEFKGTLGKSAASFADFLDWNTNLSILEERLSYYSMLRSSEDEGDSVARAMSGKILMVASAAQAAKAWVDPEIMAIPEQDIQKFLLDKRLANYRISISRLLRYKPHILSEKEERIIAIQAEATGAANEAFSVLTNVDLDFGTIKTEQGEMPLSQSTWSVFMENPDRNLREKAYKQYYSQFLGHKTTLASLYASSVKQDVVNARIRGFKSARSASLFSDNVSESVYDNLISTINDNLGPLHRYYELKRRMLKVENLRHWDVYAPIVPQMEVRKRSWNEAVDEVSEALAPLGGEYVDTLRTGLLGRWSDRYENKGKRSGAFSAGSYSGDPYILMNYKEDLLRDIFTLAHEGGHSMHSYYSARNNHFASYNYTIFEAEVASTFNEELLFRSLYKKASSSKNEQIYLVNKRIDDILATLYRQAMFAEYEKIIHELEEGGTPLTCDNLRAEYRKLLQKYFGKAMILDEESDMEGLRIPHFYRAFYVYKYSTGISASISLAQRVLTGGASEKSDYFKFLKSGGSLFPLDSLKVAGVDMSVSDPIKSACAVFEGLVKLAEDLLQVP
ncbi:MAG: oligoendopeptidase F [Termitinemataceae bacterium]|nr:MAG: oligoendopeptidase F [Termitinemataceae bacterium]